ncbi:MAG TPA: ABC-type transport auxiliary lipoprotein family protein [Verrucomicrobiae bacterium]|nr:ABC-type transport auxiliary lipoprotein family protein [Verrucomicrobiae bacterium]
MKQDFTFSPSSATTSAAPKNGRVLGILKIRIAPSFDSQSLIYRTGEFSYERDPYAEFLVPPAESMEAAIREAFRQTGVFSEVTEPGGILKPNIVAEIFVGALYGDFRDSTNAAAVLAMRVNFFNATNGAPGEVLLQKNYSRSIPLKTRTAAALMAGWNEALNSIVKESASDLAAKSGGEPK